MKAWKIYLASLESKQQYAVKQTLEFAQEYIPEYEATISYAMPTLKYKGQAIIAVAAFKNHLGIYPFGKSTVERVKNKLKNADCEVSAIRYSYDNLPTREDIKIIVEAKLEELI